MLSAIMALFVSRLSPHTMRCTAVNGSASFASGGKCTVVAAAAGGRRRRRRSRTEQTFPPQQQQQLEQQQIAQPKEQQNVQLLNIADTQQAHVAECPGQGPAGNRHSRQPPQQQRVVQLWDVAAQLRLQRGSEIPVPSDRSEASGENNSNTGTSSSSSASSSRSRRSQARSIPAGSSSNCATEATASSSSATSSSTAPVWLEEHSAVEASSTCQVGAQTEYSSDAAAGQPQTVAPAASRSSGISNTVSSSGGSSDPVVAAIARLGRFLDFRERSSKEVLTKLEALEYDKAAALQVLAALQEAGLQSDARFAEMFVRTYWKSKAQSPWRLAYELRSRGVAQLHIDAAMAAVFGPSRQLPTSEVLTEKEEEVWEHLVEVCRRQVQLTSTEPQQKRKGKLYRWLQSRGHSNSTIFRVFEAVGLQSP